MFIVMRLDAPLMSFGSVVVDQFNRTDQYPLKSLLVGLFANALGWSRANSERLFQLQSRLRYGVRIDSSGVIVTDYQTVDFSPGGPSSDALAWTTRGKVEERKGQSGDGTHIRYRDYVADSYVTVVVTLVDAEQPPTLDELVAALQQPARPLFIGRKCCIPSRPVFERVVEASSVLDALHQVPFDGRATDLESRGPILVEELEAGSDALLRGRVVTRTEDKDWVNGIHVGRRHYVELVTRDAESKHE